MTAFKDFQLINKIILLGLGLISGFSFNLVFNLIKNKSKINREITQEEEDKKLIIREGVCGLIGNTPLVKINSLSELTGCEILAKAELINPGGSAKDRVALNIIEEAESKGLIKPYEGYTIYEGTVGSTGISLATICLAKGYNCVIVMPDDQAQEKYLALERLQAKIEKVRPASIIDPRQFVNRAKLLAQNDPKGYFSDQFENLANYRAHLKNTGPEIWDQTGGKIDAFVMGAGTGGTLAGITQYIKERKPDFRVLLVDPTGSGLYYKVKANTFFSPLEKEGSRKRHQVDTIVEGVGINRLTQNFSLALPNVNDAITVTDREAVLMARFVLKKDGLFIGSSTALNLVGSYKLGKKLGKGKTIVTLLCDSGLRHHTKFWNDNYLLNLGLPIDYPDNLEFLD